MNAEPSQSERKPFTLSLMPQDTERLEEIKDAIEAISVSEAIRYCIRTTRESLVREGKISAKGKRK